MNPEDFLELAEELVRGGSAAHCRSAAGRAYYALFLTCRDTLRRWGVIPSARENVHTFVRLRFCYCADIDMREIGFKLDRLGLLRNKADYELNVRQFDNTIAANQSIQQCRDGLAILSVIDLDAARAASVVTDLRSRWP